MKAILFIFLLLCTAAVNAEDAMPSSCTPIGVKAESVMLSTKKPVLVFIHNLSKSDFWITHPVSDPSASAGWSSRLQAGHWSALALDKESFEISCIESKPGHEQQVPCSGAISVCSIVPENSPTQNSGTYWAGEDMKLSALQEHLGQRGFALPGSTQ